MIHANQLLTQALVRLTHETSKLDSVLHSNALKHWSFNVQKGFRSVKVEISHMSAILGFTVGGIIIAYVRA